MYKSFKFIGPKHSNGSCRALKIYHVNTAATYAEYDVYSLIHTLEDLYVILILIGLISVPQMGCFAKRRKSISGFALKSMKITYSCKTLPGLTKIFAFSEFPEESHHFRFVKQQRAFLKLLVYKSAPEIIQLNPVKCQGTVPSKLLSLMLTRLVLF